MSYRLINANTIAESYTEVHDMPCIYADLPRGLDGGHYDMRGMDELQSENAKLREYAPEATLGRGTCKADKLCDGYLYYTSYWCRGCGERFAYRPIGGKDRGASPKFCPNCGAKFVGPTTNDVDAEVTDG